MCTFDWGVLAGSRLAGAGENLNSAQMATSTEEVDMGLGVQTANTRESTNRKKKTQNEKGNPSALAAFFVFCSYFLKSRKANVGVGGLETQRPAF